MTSDNSDKAKFDCKVCLLSVSREKQQEWVINMKADERKKKRKKVLTNHFLFIEKSVLTLKLFFRLGFHFFGSA